jgi:hypothetical protein
MPPNTIDQHLKNCHLYRGQLLQVSISPTFLSIVFLYDNVICDFSILKVGVCNFLQKDFDRKAAHKALVNLT